MSLDYSNLPRWKTAYRLEQKLHSGTDGAVHRALPLRCGAHGEYHALKFTNAHAESPSITREAEVLKSFSHPNVLQLLGCYSSEGQRLVLAFPEADSDLQRVLWRRPGRKLGGDLSRTAASQCFRGLAYVHERGVVHRDLKPANILVYIEATPRFVLADFGRSRRVDGAARRLSSKRRMTLDARCDLARASALMTGGLATAIYSAPELFCHVDDDNCSYGFSVDCWSLGTIVFELLVGDVFLRAATTTARYNRAMHYNVAATPSQPA